MLMILLSFQKLENESTGGFFLKSSWSEDNAGGEVDDTDKSVERFLQAGMNRY